MEVLTCCIHRSTQENGTKIPLMDKAETTKQEQRGPEDKAKYMHAHVYNVLS